MRIGKAKTRGSLASVIIPDAVLSLLNAWVETLDKTPDGLLFPSTKPGVPMRPEVWLKRRIRPVAERLRITARVNFQVMRRTFATKAQEFGSVKSAQTHLRHSNASTPMNIYQQPVDSAVREMVNSVTESVMGLPVTGRFQ
jgi:integrase